MRRAWVGAAVALVGLPVAAAAQAGSCELRESQRVQRSPGYVAITGPLLVACAGGAELRAQQAILFELARELHLMGEVRFRDPEKTLSSDNAVYTSSTGRLYATGNVVVVDRRTGSTVRGPELEYYRAVPGRPQPQAFARGRPHLTLSPQEPVGGRREPFEVDADQVVLQGDRVTAQGRVVARRADLDATAQELFYDRAAGQLLLQGDPVVTVRRDGRVVTLRGATIDLAGARPGTPERTVVARGDARLLGQDLRVDAATLSLVFRRDSLERLVATGGRPAAQGRRLRFEGDSLDLRLPGQRLERAVAVGRAAATLEDSVPRDAAASADWIRGDTLVATFAPPPPPDTVPALESLDAYGHARAFYRVRPDTATTPRAGSGGPSAERARRWAYNYVEGERIALTFRQRQVVAARVERLRRGLYLDPEPAPTATAP